MDGHRVIYICIYRDNIVGSVAFLIQDSCKFLADSNIDRSSYMCYQLYQGYQGHAC